MFMLSTLRSITRTPTYNQAKRKMNSKLIFENLKQCIPALDGNQHKGQAGRIGVIGGSLEYTGAPYFAGISALKVGADLVHIFCASSAATVIKSYSPELIVHPLLDTPSAVTDIIPWLDRLHALVIGPGLGRKAETIEVVCDLIRIITDKKIPLIIDADGLFIITENPEIIKDVQSPVILTPNKIEFERLANKLNGEAGLRNLNKYIIILRKGGVDELICSDSSLEWKIDSGGSGRRCGGQGDLLSGSIATFMHWSISNNSNSSIKTYAERALIASSVSCYAAAHLIRLCNQKAFKVNGRSMLASDMIKCIHESFEELFGY